MNTIIEKIRAEVNRLKPRIRKICGEEVKIPVEKVREKFDTLLSVLSDLEKEEKPTLQVQPVDTSEDERINTAIFKALSKKDARDVLKECGVDVGDALDYLKRQSKEQPVEVHPLFRVGDYVRNKTTKDKVLIEQLDMEKKIYFYFTWDGAAEVHSDFSFSKQDEWELIGQTVADKQSVCEDVEEAAENYAYGESNDKYQGFVDGASWQKEQMMKEAVEGTVSAVILHENGDEVHYAVTYPEGKRPHSIIDKVRIIIVKED
jgi:hypothetical protein